MPGTLTIAGMTSGLPSGIEQTGPVTMTGTATVGETLDLTLTAGDNTVVVPDGAYAVAVFFGAPPVTATVKVRSTLDPADAGLAISPFSGAGFAVFPLPAGSSPLILNASSQVTSVELKFI